MAIIGTIRKHSWVAVLIVGIAILAFILGDLTKNRGGIPDMGSVNATTLTNQRFNELVAEMENNYKSQYQVAQVPAEAEMQIREQVWQQFVDETLLEEQTAKLGLKVTPAEVSDMYTGQFIHPSLRQMFTNIDKDGDGVSDVEYTVTCPVKNGYKYWCRMGVKFNDTYESWNLSETKMVEIPQ